MAQQDSVTPAVTTTVAVTVSLLGNLVAVGVMKLGIIGAAATTVATQVRFAAGRAQRRRSSGEQARAEAAAL